MLYLRQFSVKSSLVGTRDFQLCEKGSKSQRALTSRANGSFLMSSSVLRWYLRISRNATVPGRNLCCPAAEMAITSEGWLCTCILDLGFGMRKTIGWESPERRDDRHASYGEAAVLSVLSCQAIFLGESERLSPCWGSSVEQPLPAIGIKASWAPSSDQAPFRSMTSANGRPFKQQFSGLTLGLIWAFTLAISLVVLQGVVHVPSQEALFLCSTHLRGNRTGVKPGCMQYIGEGFLLGADRFASSWLRLSSGVFATKSMHTAHFHTVKP